MWRMAWLIIALVLWCMPGPAQPGISPEPPGALLAKGIPRVPVRTLERILGGRRSENTLALSFYVNRRVIEMRFEIYHPTVQVNGMPATFKMAPILIEGLNYLAIDDIRALFAIEVTFDRNTRQVTLIPPRGDAFVTRADTSLAFSASTADPGGIAARELHAAAALGLLPRVKELVRQHPEAVTAFDKTGVTALSRALETGQLEIAAYLLEHGAQINAQMPVPYYASSSPLHLTVQDGNLAAMKFLLAHGAKTDLPAADSDATPLHLAARAGNLAAVRLLVAAGAPVDAVDKFEIDTPLFRAAFSGNPEVVTYLLDHGAKVDTRDKQGETPLKRIARQGNVVMVKTLLDRGADVNARDTRCGESTPLMDVLEELPEQREAREAVVNLLLDRGAKVDVRDVDGETALSIAVRNAGNEIVRRILEKGADPNTADSQHITPLHLAQQRPDAVVAGLLLDRGARVDARDKLGNTPLHQAAEWGDTTHIAMLIAHGAEVDARNAAGETPLFAAIHEPAVITMLLTCGADINAKLPDGTTALHRAAEWCVDYDGEGNPTGGDMLCSYIYDRHTTTARVLLAAGADPNAARRDGTPPLHLAARDGFMLIVKELLEHGADANAQDQQHHTAFFYAAVEKQSYDFQKDVAGITQLLEK